jgi:hypothetical protein
MSSGASTDTTVPLTVIFTVVALAPYRSPATPRHATLKRRAPTSSGPCSVPTSPHSPFSDAMSIEKRYFTSERSMRS